MMDKDSVQAKMAAEMPEGWTFTVRETTNKIMLLARRPNNAGRYECSFGKQDHIALRDFLAMCNVFAGATS
jgi:hypothetical protein